MYYMTHFYVLLKVLQLISQGFTKIIFGHFLKHVGPLHMKMPLHVVDSL